MLSLKKLILFNLAFFAISTGAYSQSNGFVNFNLDTFYIKPTTKHQPVTLFGCNTVIQVDSNYPSAPKGGFVWGAKNQILSDVPYGLKTDPITNGKYFVSKYYIASPPIFHGNASGKPDNNTVYDIGIVTPDEFIFSGNAPVQQVFLDYNVLDSTQITYFPVVFDSSFQKLADSLSNKISVDYVPFKVECADFNWLDLPGMSGGAGASGIGYFNRQKSDTAQLFLPYPALTKDNRKIDYLDCKVTILNDILLHYEVFFVVGGVKMQTIDLKDHVLNHPKEPITFHCEYRWELPCGCLPIAGARAYGEE